MNARQRRTAYRRARRLMRSATPVLVPYSHFGPPKLVVTRVTAVVRSRGEVHAQVIVPTRWNGDRGERIVHVHNLREVPRSQRFNYEGYRHEHR